MAVFDALNRKQDSEPITMGQMRALLLEDITQKLTPYSKQLTSDEEPSKEKTQKEVLKILKKIAGQDLDDEMKKLRKVIKDSSEDAEKFYKEQIKATKESVKSSKMFVEGVTTALEKGFKGSGTYFKRVFKPLGEGIEESVNIFKRKMNKAFSLIGNTDFMRGIKYESIKIRRAFSRVGRELKEEANKFGDWVKTQFKNFGSYLFNKLKAGGDFFVTSFKKVMNSEFIAGVKHEWNEIKKAFSDAAVGFSDSMKTIFGSAKAAITNSVQRWIISPFQALGNSAFVKNAKNIASKMGSAISKFIDPIKNKFSWIFRQIDEITKPIRTGVKKTAAEIFKRNAKQKSAASDVSELIASPEEASAAILGDGKKKGKRGKKVRGIRGSATISSAGSNDICNCIRQETSRLISAMGEKGVTIAKDKTEDAKKLTFWQKVWKSSFKFMTGKKGDDEEGGGLFGGGRRGRWGELSTRNLLGIDTVATRIGNAIASEQPVQEILTATGSGGRFLGNLAQMIPVIGDGLGLIIQDVFNAATRPLVQGMTHFQQTRQTAFQTMNIFRGPAGNIAESQRATAMQEELLRAYNVGLREIDLTGKSISTIQQTQIRLWRRGITEARTLNRVMVAGLHTATMLGSSSEETANLFADMHQNLQLGSSQLAAMGTGLRSIARQTGITGDNLIQIVRSSETFMRNLRNSGTLTAQAGQNITSLMAEATTTGTQEGMQRFLTTLSSDFLSGEGDDRTRNLMMIATGGRGDLLDALMNNTLLSDPAKMRAFSQGLEGLFNSITGGQSVATMDPNRRAALNSQTRNTFGVGIREFELLIQNTRNASRTFEERQLDIQQQLARGDISDARRQQLQSDLSNLRLDNNLTRLRNLDQALEDSRGNVAGAFARTGGRENIRNSFTQTIEELNRRLTELGLQNRRIDPTRVREALDLNDASMIRNLVDEITQAEQASLVQQRKNNDPITKIEQTVLRIEALIQSLVHGLLVGSGTFIDFISREFETSGTGQALNNLIDGQGSWAELGTAFMTDMRNFGTTARRWRQEIGNMGMGGGAAQNILTALTYLPQGMAAAISLMEDVVISIRDIVHRIRESRIIENLGHMAETLRPVIDAVGDLASAIDESSLAFAGFAGIITAFVLSNPLALVVVGGAVLINEFRKLCTASVDLANAKEREREMSERYHRVLSRQIEYFRSVEGRADVAEAISLQTGSQFSSSVANRMAGESEQRHNIDLHYMARALGASGAERERILAENPRTAGMTLAQIGQHVDAWARVNTQGNRLEATRILNQPGYLAVQQQRIRANQAGLDTSIEEFLNMTRPRLGLPDTVGAGANERLEDMVRRLAPFIQARNIVPGTGELSADGATFYYKINGEDPNQWYQSQNELIPQLQRQLSLPPFNLNRTQARNVLNNLMSIMTGGTAIGEGVIRPPENPPAAAVGAGAAGGADRPVAAAAAGGVPPNPMAALAAITARIETRRNLGGLPAPVFGGGNGDGIGRPTNPGFGIEINRPRTNPYAIPSIPYAPTSGFGGGFGPSSITPTMPNPYATPPEAMPTMPNPYVVGSTLPMTDTETRVRMARSGGETGSTVTARIEENTSGIEENTDETNELLRTMIARLDTLLTPRRRGRGNGDTSAYDAPYMSGDLFEEIEWPQQFMRHPGLDISSDRNV